ncbi:ATP-binding protein [Leucobacter sp. wl10]|uniref:ATP-binding protein n=1 Tax=Leucobacter sp. wl10 TaxID=2304677 RepID=UPI000E5A5566|nr:ATP-binding protein [Leucobacter sp. wl10]RGE19480.1 ATP-binding protein [Leucobacter sp. wl10]
MDRIPLTRPRDDRVIAGVCGGLAAHLGVPVGPVRVGMLVMTLLGGFGGLLYLWLWGTVPGAGDVEGIVPLRRALTRPAERPSPAGAAAPPVPAAAISPRAPVSSEPTAAAPDPRPAGAGPREPGLPESAPPARGPAVPRRRWPVAELLLGACLLVTGAGLVLERLGVQLELELLLPALAVLAGVGLAWWQIADRDRPDRHQLPRVLAALALVAVGVLMFFVTAREPSAWTVIAAAVSVLAGVALAVAPWLLRVNRELMAERAARAREAERSDIAAHLHDSVLQTLALIQQRSEPGSDIARLARGQERELREWLFRGADGGAAPARAAVDAELRAHAQTLEAHHPVRFEIVAVGVGAGLLAPDALVAAAREAMLNAARHAGGEVTVYLEATRDRIAVDVTDRGLGLDLDDLPEGRMGVRESILGRMERAGGTARIVRGPGGSGTSVRLSIPRENVDGVEEEEER